MRKRDELTAGCMAKARDDEMCFVLLGRDVTAPNTIRDWIGRRLAAGKNRPEDPQIVEAEECARTMEAEWAALRERLSAATTRAAPRPPQAAPDAPGSPQCPPGDPTGPTDGPAADPADCRPWAALCDPAKLADHPAYEHTAAWERWLARETAAVLAGGDGEIDLGAMDGDQKTALYVVLSRLADGGYCPSDTEIPAAWEAFRLGSYLGDIARAIGVKGTGDELIEAAGRLRRERDALADFPVLEWPGGGFVVRMPWRAGGYAGGTRDTLEGLYHFGRAEDARAAVRIAAGLDGETAAGTTAPSAGPDREDAGGKTMPADDRLGDCVERVLAGLAGPAELETLRARNVALRQELAEARARVGQLERIALAAHDGIGAAIRRPMGVVPDAAVEALGLIAAAGIVGDDVRRGGQVVRPDVGGRRAGAGEGRNDG